MSWHIELRAMKTVVAGAVGANCGEANLTHCGPGCHQAMAWAQHTSLFRFNRQQIMGPKWRTNCMSCISRALSKHRKAVGHRDNRTMFAEGGIPGVMANASLKLRTGKGC